MCIWSACSTCGSAAVEHSSAVWSDLKLKGTVKEEFEGSFGNGRTTQHARF